MIDTEDEFPTDRNETSDNDGDGIGDNIDIDDDNDGILDTYEDTSFNVEYLIVAGGGNRHGAGGGAGGLLTGSISLTTNKTFNITVGQGGSGGSSTTFMELMEIILNYQRRNYYTWRRWCTII